MSVKQKITDFFNGIGKKIDNRYIQRTSGNPGIRRIDLHFLNSKNTGSMSEKLKEVVRLKEAIKGGDLALELLGDKFKSKDLKEAIKKVPGLEDILQHTSPRYRTTNILNKATDLVEGSKNLSTSERNRLYEHIDDLLDEKNLENNMDVLEHTLASSEKNVRSTIQEDFKRSYGHAQDAYDTAHQQTKDRLFKPLVATGLASLGLGSAAAIKGFTGGESLKKKKKLGELHRNNNKMKRALKKYASLKYLGGYADEQISETLKSSKMGSEGNKALEAVLKAKRDLYEAATAKGITEKGIDDLFEEYSNRRTGVSVPDFLESKFRLKPFHKGLLGAAALATMGAGYLGGKYLDNKYSNYLDKLTKAQESKKENLKKAIKQKLRVV